jgi:hypothetical protein
MVFPRSYHHFAIFGARVILFQCFAGGFIASPVHAEEPSRAAAPDLMAIARGYADAMIDHSRENLPDPKLPLFPIVLTRDTYTIPQGKVGNLVTARVPQEFKTIANPHHDLNLYQLFYALTTLTGEPRYAAEADRVLGYFLMHCQEPKYGFFCWGEHLGWDVVHNAPGGFPPEERNQYMVHEFYRPWVFWEKSFALAPDACQRFARTVWRHQINHQGSLSFSRHAMIAKGDNPSRRGLDFPRHAGFYIDTWAAAYRHKADPEMAQAIEKMVDSMEKRRDPKSGAIAHGTLDFAVDSDGNTVQYVFTPSMLGLAVDLENAAPAMPPPLAERMRALAASIDQTFLATAHDPGPGGKGFILFTDPATLAAREYWVTKEDLDAGKPPRRVPYTGGWRSSYSGQHPHTWITPAIIARYKQTKDDGCRRLFVACAENYLTANPDPALLPEPGRKGNPPDIEAGSIGNAIVLLNEVHKATGEEKFLTRAEWFAAWAVRKFWPDKRPLPRASVRENIYSAASRCDTLALAMLQTALLRSAPEREKQLGLLATDR